MKSSFLILALHCLEMQRKHKRDFTSNQESISLVISIGRSDITTVLVVSIEKWLGLLFRILLKMFSFGTK